MLSDFITWRGGGDGNVILCEKRLHITKGHDQKECQDKISNRARDTDGEGCHKIMEQLHHLFTINSVYISTHTVMRMRLISDELLASIRFV